MKSYSATFRATVDDAKEGSPGNELAFGLHGDGAMPSVSITQPLARDQEGGGAGIGDLRRDRKSVV